MENKINLPFYPYDQNTYPWQPAYDWFFHNTKDKKDILKLALSVLADTGVTFPGELSESTVAVSTKMAFNVIKDYCDGKKDCIGCSFLGVEEKGSCYLRTHLSNPRAEFDIEKALSHFVKDDRDSISIKTGGDHSISIGTGIYPKTGTTTSPNVIIPFVTGTCTSEDLKTQVEGTIATTTNNDPITFRAERGGRGKNFFDDYAGDEFHKSLGKKGLKRLKKWEKKNSGMKD